MSIEQASRTRRSAHAEGGDRTQEPAPGRRSLGEQAAAGPAGAAGPGRMAGADGAATGTPQARGAGDLDGLTQRMFGAMASTPAGLAASASGGAMASAPARQLPAALRARLETSYAADLGAVTLVEDGVAEQLGVPAAARGTVIHLARGAFDPDSQHGKHVLAHEVAHVVQQGAVAANGSPEPAQRHTDVSLEREAELAASAALSGATAKLTRGAAPTALMGFDSWEHKLLGDSLGGADYSLGQISLTHGDILMLSGDYFDARPDARPDDKLFVLAHTPSKHPGQEVGTVDEVLCALDDCQQHHGSDPRFAEGGVWSHIKFSDDVTTRMKGRFKRLAIHNREHFAQPEADRTEYGPREAAGGSYRNMHETALMAAYVAGTKAGDVGDALAFEAAGQHFLTDGFSAGHLRTPRADLQKHWGRVYPDFGERLVNTLAELVGLELSASAAAPTQIVLGGLFGPGAPLQLVEQARKQVKKKLGEAGPPSFGDVMSSLLHDADNEHGLKVSNDLGWEWIAYGDDHLLDGPPGAQSGGRSHVDIIKLAVALGADDVTHAYELGRRDAKAPRPREVVMREVRAMTLQPARPGQAKYGAEQLMPRLYDSSNGEQEWKADSFSQLLPQLVRTDMPGFTIEQALIASARGGTVGNQLSSVANSLATEEEVGGHKIGLYTYQAFRDAVLVPLRKDPVALFRLILGES